MISKKMQEAINAQINAELWSAYLYLSMSMDAADKGFKGSAHWFVHQFKEEQGHAEKLAGYLQSQNAKVVLAPIAAVQTEWPSVVAMFEDTLAHEQKVTAMIHDLCKLAAAEQDFATANMLQWFVNEQVEEEDTARGILEGFKAIEGEKVGVYMLDQKLGARYTRSRTFSLSRAQSRTCSGYAGAGKRRTKFNDFSAPHRPCVGAVLRFQGKASRTAPARTRGNRTRAGSEKGAPARRRHSP